MPGLTIFLKTTYFVNFCHKLDQKFRFTLKQFKTSCVFGLNDYHAIKLTVFEVDYIKKNFKNGSEQSERQQLSFNIPAQTVFLCIFLICGGVSYRFPVDAGSKLNWFCHIKFWVGCRDNKHTACAGFSHCCKDTSGEKVSEVVGLQEFLSFLKTQTCAFFCNYPSSNAIIGSTFIISEVRSHFFLNRVDPFLLNFGFTQVVKVPRKSTFLVILPLQNRDSEGELFTYKFEINFK